MLLIAGQTAGPNEQQKNFNTHGWLWGVLG